MSGRIRNPSLGIFLNVGIGIAFMIAAVIVVMVDNYSDRQQAISEAQSKARLILDRNFATHTYFSEIMKPSIFAWSEPFRTQEYFDPTWMSSTYAIRETEKYFRSFSPSEYYFKDAALNARSPENEADEYERAFLEKLGADKKLESESTIHKIGGEPYLAVLRKGEVMEESCLRCHGNPKDAPKGLTDYYGSERSFDRKTGDVVSAVSLRIPLSVAYAAADISSLKLSAILLIILGCLFTTQSWFYRQYLLKPLNVIKEKATQIAAHEEHLGEQVSQPFGRELNELATAFNEMSVRLRHDRDHLEELVDKRTETLRETSSLLKNTFDAIPDLLTVHNRNLRVVLSNWHEREYVTEEERRSMPYCYACYMRREKPCEHCPTLEVFRTGRAVTTEVEDRYTCRIHEVSAYPVFDASGKVELVMEHVRDITERKHAEEMLRRSEENFRRSLEESPLGVRIVTEEGETIYANPAILNIYGYDSIDDLKTTPAKKRYTPESYSEFQIRKEKRKQGDYDPSEYEISVVRKDGEVRHLRVVRKDILWDGERQFQVICQDMTERKKMEKDLNEKRKLLVNVVDSTPDFIFAKDTELRTILCNKAYAGAIGKKPDELIGHTDIENGWDPELVKGNPAKGIRGFENDDRDVLSGKVVHNPNPAKPEPKR